MEYNPVARFRVDLPRAERRHPWLRHLFDLYALVDASVAEALDDAGREGRRAGCAKGCHNCCRQMLIPVTPLEAAGLRWYVREEMARETLAALRERSGTRGTDGGPDCRFLLAGVCAAYSVRPVACRRYMVLGSPCAPGEDAVATRPAEVLRPSREKMNAAYAATLPYYAALGEETPEPEGAFAFMAARTVLLATLAPDILQGR
ncbi:MAG: YkgJ family cysteine cluster protein [Deltaproteobacteria bacterium]|jgi:Fe-S-cluster containining protein|nr:YkgJ family cysteine cluster protein [Deltaproteobacteria bacterium]